MLIRSFFTNSVGTLVSRIFGFIRDLLSASVLGANIYSDIFFVAFKFPNLFRRIFAEGAFTQSFIPAFIASPQKGLFTFRITVYFFSFLIAFSLTVTFFSEFFSKMIAFGFSDEMIQLAAPLVAINFYYLPLIFIVTLLGSLLQYKHHFATTAFSTALLNIGMIGALILFQNWDKKTIVYALSYGVLLGGFLQVFSHLIVIGKYRLFKLFIVGYRAYGQKEKRIQKTTQSFNQSFFHSIIGNSTPQIVSFVDTTLASFLVSGSISYLYYGNRIFQLPLALFAIALTTGIFPHITRLLKNNDEIKALALVDRGFWILAFLLSTSTLGGYLLSEEIIQLLFQRGAFSAEDSEQTGFVLSMYMIGLLPFGLSKLFSLWLYAQMKQKIAAKIAVIALTCNLIFSFALIGPLGAAGLALAGSLSGIILFIFTLRAFGFSRFLAILLHQKLLILTLVLAIEAGVLLWFKDFLHAYL